MRKPQAVPRLWPGETVVCLASGPSLTADDVQIVRGKARVIVVNTTYTLAPWADALYAADARWWKWHKGARDFHGLKFSVSADSAPDVMLVGRGKQHGLSLDPTRISLGWNSGYQAINLAVLLGAARIILLGYDMAAGPNGKQHWHADHPLKIRSPYETFQRAFPTLVEPLTAAGIAVINCSRKTALTCFPRQALEDVFSVEAIEAVA